MFFGAVALVFGLTGLGNAATVDIFLTDNPPPLSTDLESYISDYVLAVGGGGRWIQVGFDGFDMGSGAGNGWDEIVAFSFQFTPLVSVTSATLQLGITPKHYQKSSDELLFADNGSLFNDKYYGNSLIRPLNTNNTYDVTFDLRNMAGQYGSGNTYDLSDLLLDGDLDVVYQDDSFIHYARLTINGNAVPVPAAIWLFGSGLLGFAGFRKKLMN
jgi:hypothetical protein